MMFSPRLGGFYLTLDNLPPKCCEIDLIRLLQPYGKLHSVTIHRQNQRFGHQLSVGATVEYQTREQTEIAAHLLDSNLIWGRKLSVYFSAPPSPAASLPAAMMNSAATGTGSGTKQTRSAQVHISYLTKQLGVLVTEQMIFDLFSSFGHVLEVSLKKKCVDTEMSIQNGYGFVHYPLTNEGIDSALKAVEALHQVTINNVSYDCSVSNQLRQVLFNTGRLLKRNDTSPWSTAQDDFGALPRNECAPMSSSTGDVYASNRNRFYEAPPSPAYSSDHALDHVNFAAERSLLLRFGGLPAGARQGDESDSYRRQQQESIRSRVLQQPALTYQSHTSSSLLGKNGFEVPSESTLPTSGSFSSVFSLDTIAFVGVEAQERLSFSSKSTNENFISSVQARDESTFLRGLASSFDGKLELFASNLSLGFGSVNN